MNAAMDAPVPGKAPKKLPMPVPRNIGNIESFTSLRVGVMDFQVMSSLTSPSRDWLIPEITSEMPNMPMAKATKLMPSINSGISKSKRGVPELMSVPTVPSNKPKNTIASPLAGEPDASVDAAINPNSIMLKYSAGPILRPSSAMAGENKIRIRMPSIEPTKDAMVVMNKATPALPCLAMG